MENPIKMGWFGGGVKNPPLFLGFNTHIHIYNGYTWSPALTWDRPGPPISLPHRREALKLGKSISWEADDNLRSSMCWMHPKQNPFVASEERGHPKEWNGLRFLHEIFDDIVKICSDEHDLRDFLLQNKILNLTLTPNP